MRRWLLVVPALAACIKTPHDKIRDADDLVDEGRYKEAAALYSEAMDDSLEDDWMKWHQRRGMNKTTLGMADDTMAKLGAQPDNVEAIKAIQIHRSSIKSSGGTEAQDEQMRGMLAKRVEAEVTAIETVGDQYAASARARALLALAPMSVPMRDRLVAVMEKSARVHDERAEKMDAKYPYAKQLHLLSRRASEQHRGRRDHRQPRHLGALRVVNCPLTARA
jgi:hypothetical protein